MDPVSVNMAAVAESYHKRGWSLVPFQPGNKGPTGFEAKGWQLRERCIGPGRPFPANMSMGLAHAYSQTCSVDIDDMARAIAWGLDNGIDIQGLLNAVDAVQILSGVSNHGKLIYRLPDEHPTLPTVTFTHEKKHMLQFRCATRRGTTTQDVLPPSIHPDTQQPYRWGGQGDFTAIPLIPDALLTVWLAKLETSETIKPTGDVQTSEGEIESALSAIDPDIHRDDWVRIGMAIHSADAGLYHLFEEWSSHGLKFTGAHDCESVWASFTNVEDGVTIRTLFQRAREAGWRGYRRPADDVFKEVDFSQTLPGVKAQLTELTEQQAPIDWSQPPEPPLPDTAPQIAVEDYWGLHRASNIIHEPAPAINLLVPDLVPMEGVTGLTAPAGHGKSNMMLQLGWAMTTESPLFNNPSWSVPQGAAYILEAEDRLATFHRRLAHLAQVYPDQAARYGQQGFEMYFHNPAGKDMRLTDHYGKATAFADHLIQHIKTAPTPIRVLLVGPLINLSGGAEDNEGTQAVLRELDRISVECGCAVIVPHHVSKTSAINTDRSEFAARGGGSFTGAVRAQIHLQNMGADEAEKYGVTDAERPNWVGISLTKGNDLPPMAEPVWLQRNPGGASMGWVPDQPVPRKKEDVTKRRPLGYAEVIRQVKTLMGDAQADWTVTAFSQEYGGTGGVFGLARDKLRSVIVRACLEGKLANRQEAGLAGKQTMYLRCGRESASDVFESVATPEFLN